MTRVWAGNGTGIEFDGEGSLDRKAASQGSHRSDALRATGQAELNAEG